MSDKIKDKDILSEAPIPYRTSAGGENIVKKARDDLGFKNYQELADALGYQLATLNQAASKQPSTQLRKAIEMLYKIHELEKQLSDYKTLKTILNRILN